MVHTDPDPFSYRKDTVCGQNDQKEELPKIANSEEFEQVLTCDKTGNVWIYWLSRSSQLTDTLPTHARPHKGDQHPACTIPRAGGATYRLLA